jgi:hypothetical protein
VERSLHGRVLRARAGVRGDAERAARHSASSHDTVPRVSSRRGRHGAVRLGITWLAVLWVWVSWRPAFAQAEGPSSYEVPPECTPRPQWLAELGARLPPLLRTHPLLETLSVRIEREDTTGEAYVGELSSGSDAALGRSRSVRGARCEEVLDALSFIAALGLERAASSGRTAGTELTGSSAAPMPEAEQRAVDAYELRAPGEPLGARRNLRLGAVAFALLQGRLTPGQSAALGVAFRLAWSSRDWQPLFMLGAYSSLPEQQRLAGGGGVRFEHWSTHALACPWRFPQSGAWGLRPCLDLDVGRSHGEGFGVAGAQRHSAPWLSGGAQLRAELALWNRVELSASAGVVAPFWRAHFFFLPDVQSFETPALGFRAGSSASLLF